MKKRGKLFRHEFILLVLTLFTLFLPSVFAVSPILVIIDNSVGSFGNYTGEILKAEGMPEFQMEDITLLNETYLNNFDVVILNSIPLSSGQVTMLENYVSSGGNLIVFKPDTQLASLIGVTIVGTNTSEGYIKVDNTSEIGKGITGETIQYHTSANHYSLNGASEIAKLYYNATGASSYSAITINNYGSGQAVAFTYDLPKSIAYQRQGNPLWKGQERDGINTVRANDMFYSNEVGVPHWINPDKTMIPQADEQDKVLANAINFLNRDTKPLPRLWYFPSLNETVLVNRDGDTDNNDIYIYDLLDGIERYDGRTTLYLMPYNIITAAESASIKARGHGVSLHVNAGCGAAKTYEQMNASFTTQTNNFISLHGFHPRTEVNHCGEWVGWVEQAKIQENLGYEMDLNYFPWLPTDGGYMTGASQPIKFVDENGTIINVFQQGYQVEDNLVGQGRTCQTLTDLTIQLIDDSIEKYHTPVVMHIHPVYYQPANCKMQWANDSWQHANDKNIAIVSSDMWLDFTRMRYNTTIENITWDNYQLSFKMDIADADYEITVMVPSSFKGKDLRNVTRDGINYPYVTQTIDNREYAMITTSASIHNFIASYEPPEFVAPSWQNQGQSSSTVEKGEAVVLYAQGKDETALSQAILSTNETGTWENKTSYGSPMDMNGTTDWTWSNFIWQNPSIEIGTVVGWRIYYVDSSGNTNVTDVMTFTITVDTTPPIWTNQGQNASNILTGKSVLLYAEGKDNAALKWAWLVTNESGEWKNYTTQYELTTFNDSTSSKTITFDSAGSKVDAWIRILKDAQVTEGGINISGLSTEQINLDQQNIYTAVAYNDIFTSNWIGQSFVAGISGKLSIVSIYLYKLGSPISNAYVRIYNCPSGTPSGSSIASKTITPSELGTSNNVWFNVTFDSPAAIVASNTYCYAVESSVTDTLNRYRLGATSPQTGYPSGTTVFTSNQGASWGTVGYDEPFQIYVSTAGSYPDSPTLNFGNTVPDDWSMSGSLNDTNSPQQVNLDITKLNNILSSCDCPGCSISGDYCTVPVNVSSQSAGIIQLDSLSIKYNIALKMQENDQWQLASFTWDNDSFTEGTVGWKIYFADTVGNENVTDVMAFTVGPDTIAPSWQNQGQSPSTPSWGDPVYLFAEGKDETGLSQAILATNENGTWENKTSYGSPMDMGGVADTWVLSNFTWLNVAIPVNTSVAWKIYYIDSSGNSVETDEMVFTLQPPETVNVSVPILVLVNSLSSNKFGRYIGEILKAEGLNEFEIAEISSVSFSYLSSFDFVLLTEMSLDSSQVSMLQNYVSNGGNLIGFKPDVQLESVFGLTSVGTNTSEGYILVDNTTEIGTGIVGETIQFHGIANNYNLNGASEIARLYSDATTSTSYPAVTVNSYGSGQAVAFTYDLVKSTILLRQGNPANVGLRNRPTGLHENYLDTNKVPIPQADEQMRVLTNVIFNLDNSKPLPRLWYFPDFKKTMLVMNLYEYGPATGGAAAINQQVADVEARGGKTSFYITESHSSSNVQNWTSRGHEVSILFMYGISCPITGDYSTFNTAYTNEISTFESSYGFRPRTSKHNCIAWFDYGDVGDIQQSHGVNLDGNYIPYFDNIAWFSANGYKNGWITGSGIPMKFVNTTGIIYDSYQLAINFCDECQTGGGQGGMTGEAAALAASELFNKSRDGFYTVFGSHFYVARVGAGRTFELKLMDYAQEYGIPIWNSLQLLNFIDAKNNASFENITYSGNQLGFVLKLPSEVNNLTVMVPYNFNGLFLNNITLDSVNQLFSTETIKGVEYAWFVVNSIGDYEVIASYSTETIPPVITIVYPVNGTALPSSTTSTPINITTDENADCRYNLSNSAFDYETEGIDFTDGQGTTKHSFILSGLEIDNTYDLYYKCKDVNGNVNSVSTHHRFSVEFIDTKSPSWRSQGQSTSSIEAGESVLLYAEGKDETGLDYAFLSTNETGVWKNYTASAWYNSSWLSRKNIIINNTQNTETLTDYQVALNITYDPDMASDFSDLRFTDDSQETGIPYWIEKKVDSSWAYVWVKVPQILASASTDIYVYYDSVSPVASKSNLADVFIREINGAQPVSLSLPFDENTGTTAYDKSGNGNDGTLINNPTWVNGKYGKALSFDGVDDYVAVSDSASLDISGTAVTVEAWASASGPPGTHRYIESKSDGGGLTGYSMYTGTTQKIFFFFGNGATATLTPDVAGFAWDGTWKHIVGQYNGSHVKIYVNGQFKGQNPATGNIATNDLNMHIGKYVGGTNNFNGVIDELRIYNRALNDAEISDLYNNRAYTTPSYPGRVLLMKFTPINPTSTVGPEERQGVLRIDMGNTTEWTWSNFTWQNSEITEATIGWMIYYVDTFSNSNSTDIMTFNIVDLPPTWRNQGQNTSTIESGESILLYAEGYDKNGLSSAILSTNETGMWINWTNVTESWTQTTKAEFDSGEMVNLTTDSPGSIKFNTTYIVNDDFEDGTLEGLTLIANTDTSTLENVVYQGSRRAKITDTDTGATRWKIWEKIHTSAPLEDYIGEIDISVESMDAYSAADLIVLARNSVSGHCVILKQNPDDVNFDVYVYDGAYQYIGTVSMDKGTDTFHTYKAYFVYGNKTVYIYRDGSLIGSYTFANNLIDDNYRMTSSYQGTTTYYFDNYRVYTTDQSLTGTFISSSYDAGSNPDYQTISWTSTEPAGSSIKLQVATNNDDSTWNFVGPDGTSNTYYDTSGVAVHSSHDGDRYIKYKAYFSRSDYTTATVLDDVSITFKANNYAEYGSPLDMGDVADTWSMSSFVWQNAGITEGSVSWMIYYLDTAGKENVTEIMSFTVGLVCETEADTDDDGNISMPELMAYIDRWYAVEIDMPELMKAIGYWYVGTGC